MKYLAMLAAASPLIVLFLLGSILSNIYTALQLLVMVIACIVLIVVFLWGMSYLFDEFL